MYLTDEYSQVNPEPEIFVVGGGKGGVGKTCFSVNLSVEIARKGWRVVLVDADLSCANVETVLGTQAEGQLDDFFNQQGPKDLNSILFDTQYENLSILPGTSGLLGSSHPKHQQKLAFFRHLLKIDTDIIVVDLDAGAHLNTLDFFLLTETNGIAVITPEKTSIDNAFKFLRSVLYRRIERFYRSSEVGLVLKRTASLDDFFEAVTKSGVFTPEVQAQINREIRALAAALQPKVVVNRARNAYEAQIAFNILRKYARQDLWMELQSLGHIFFDKIVPDTVNSGVPFIVSHPKSKVSTCVSDIVNRLGYL